MALDSFKPELWEKALLTQFKGNCVAEVLTLAPTSVEGSCAHFNTASVAVGIKDYTGTVDAEDVETSALELYYDQQKYWAVKLDDVEKVQLAANVMMPVINDLVYGIKKVVDTAIFKEGADNAANKIGTAAAKKQITTPEQAYNYIVELNTKLDTKDVPTEGRYIVAAPEFIALLQRDTRVLAYNAGVSVLNNGIMQGLDIAGCKVVKSNNVPAGTALVMYNKAIAFGKQIDKQEAYRDQGSFSDIVRGLIKYGVKCVRPEAIAVLHYAIAE